MTKKKIDEVVIPPIGLPLTYWESADTLSATERKKYPEGVLRTRSYKEAWAIAWANLSEEQREMFRKLPKFNAKIFEEITGVNPKRKRKNEQT